MGLLADGSRGPADREHYSGRGRPGSARGLHRQSDYVVGAEAACERSKNSMTVLTLNVLSVVVLLVFNLSSMRVTLVGAAEGTHAVHQLAGAQPDGADSDVPGVGDDGVDSLLLAGVGERVAGDA